MNVGRLIGGLVAFISGLLVLIQTTLFIEYLDVGGSFYIAWWINLGLSLLVMVSGIVGMVGKSGGVYILALGILSIILAIVSTMSIDFLFLLMQFSFFSTTLGIGPVWVIPIEAILIVLAGIISLARPSDKVNEV